MNGERTTADLARESDPGWRKIANMIRRAVVTLSARGRWQLAGFRALREQLLDVEVFQGLGLWARAPRGVQVEAVVVNVGDGKAPIVVALRDERTRAAVANALEEDATLLFNSAVGVYLTPGGLIELRTHAGTAGKLATLADLEQLRAYIDRQFSTVGGHTHAVVGAATTTTTTVAVAGTAPTNPAPTGTGTTTVRGE